MRYRRAKTLATLCLVPAFLQGCGLFHRATPMECMERANATLFHTAGHRFPYDNMHYVLVTGGNDFYEKRPSELVTQPVPPPPPMDSLTGSQAW